MTSFSSRTTHLRVNQVKMSSKHDKGNSHAKSIAIDVYQTTVSTNARRSRTVTGRVSSGGALRNTSSKLNVCQVR